jgi:hypothetical protein
VGEWVVSAEVIENPRFQSLPVARNKEQLVRGRTHLIFPDAGGASGKSGTFTLTTVDLLVRGQRREACAGHRHHGTVLKKCQVFFMRESRGSREIRIMPELLLSKSDSKAKRHYRLRALVPILLRRKGTSDDVIDFHTERATFNK